MLRSINTASLDGLRALAVMHIVLGHHAIYTGFYTDPFAPEKRSDMSMHVEPSGEDECSQQWCRS